MTIPDLVANYQKTIYVTQLKKAYSSFNQVITLMAVDNGCSGDFNCVSSISSNTTFGDELVKYFKVTKNCGVTIAGCMPTQTEISYNTAHPYGTISTDDITTFLSYRFITTDGIAYRLITFSNCSTNYSNNATGDMQQICASVMIDLNGPKPPNKLGVDAFGFYLTNGHGVKLYPWGGADDNHYGYWNGATKHCPAASDYTGYQCSARIIDEGWAINYY